MSKSPTYEELISQVDQLEQRVAQFDELYSILFQLEKKNELLKELNEKLEMRAGQLEKESEQSKRKMERLSKKVKELEHFEKENKILRRENEDLKEKLDKYENPKNSNNSSVPPSKDENRPFKSKSLRKKTGRKPGGQKGHEGTTLEMTSNPDETIDHAPEYCQCCGKDLAGTPGEFVEKKQVIDLLLRSNVASLGTNRDITRSSKRIFQRSGHSMPFQTPCPMVRSDS